MKKERVIVAIVVLLLFAGLVWILKLRPEGRPPSCKSPHKLEGDAAAGSNLPLTRDELQRRKRMNTAKATNVIQAALNTQITFHGMVVDQNGYSIPNAKVSYSLLNKFNASGSGGTTTSGVDGEIMISGVRGAVLGVNVSKDGYYQIPDESNQRFAYGMGTDNYTKPPPLEGSPTVFVLRKMGEAEPLIHLTSRQYSIPNSGQSVSIDLSTGNARQKSGGLTVSANVGDVEGNGQYNWSYEIIVQGGGISEVTEDFDFAAPGNGYQSRVILGSQALDDNWTNRDERSYFVKLPDGTHARIKVRFYPRTYKNMVVLESFLNPKPGSLNLEFDPDKAIEPGS